MGYRKIENLYRNNSILMFKQCYAMEKIHGTSAHVGYNHEKKALSFFSGGSPYPVFVSLFDQQALLEAFASNCEEHNVDKIKIYGEAYGGKTQGMKDTYGPNPKFVAFEVCIRENEWMSVPAAERIARRLGFDFVHYDLINATEDEINAVMLADSVQAVRNGVGPGKMREGVVLRPLEELIYQNGGRIICKHKRPEFAEREHQPKISDPDRLKVLEDAKEIASEWVTPMRLKHVLDAFPEDVGIESANKIIKAMVDDVLTEGKGEIVDSKEARKAIGKKTVKLMVEHLSTKK